MRRFAGVFFAWFDYSLDCHNGLLRSVALAWANAREMVSAQANAGR